MTRTVALTTIGSAGVAISVTPAAIPEAHGGVSIWMKAWGKTTSYTLTADEAKALICALADTITPELFQLPTAGER